MRFYEAMKLLEEGKKVRKTSWSADGYIYKNEEGYINDEDGNSVDTYLFTVKDEWEEYVESECFSDVGNTLETANNVKKIEEIDIESCGVRNIYDGEGNIYNKIFSIEALKKDICDKVNELIRYTGN